jgi:hypothetical protein
MPNQVKAPTASASVVAGWTNPGNVYSSNNTYATATTLAAVMVAKGFGFTIPASSRIDGIKISVEGKSASTYPTTSKYITASPTKDGTTLAGNKGSSLSLNWASDTTISWGSSGTDLWGTTWTYSQINSADFGVLLQLSGSEGTGYTRSVDYVSVTVYYTLIPLYEEVVSDSFTMNDSNTPTMSVAETVTDSFSTDDTNTPTASIAEEVADSFALNDSSQSHKLRTEFYYYV